MSDMTRLVVFILSGKGATGRVLSRERMICFLFGKGGLIAMVRTNAWKVYTQCLIHEKHVKV